MTYLRNIDNITNAAYGPQAVVQPYPVVSGNAYYNLLPANFRTFTTGTGTAEVADQVMRVTSGTVPLDYGVIRSFRSVNYQTGQGARLRISARFPNPQALTWSGAGAFNIGDELSFGYLGTDFGIWHRHGGLAEVQKLTITTPSSGTETAIVNIDGTVYNIGLTAGTAQKNAHEIATFLTNNGVGIDAEQVSNTVIVDFTSDGNKTGAFSFSSNTAVGTWTELTAGVTKTNDFYPMVAGAEPFAGVNIKESWNGTIPSGFDPSKGNTYEITYQNGYGNIHFFIEDTQTGYFQECHTIKWASSSNRPNLLNPSLRLGIYCYSVGAVVATSVESPYTAGFVDGVKANTRNPRSQDNSKSGIGATLTNIMTIRNSRTYNGYSNQIEVEPIEVIVANDGTKSGVVKVISGATLGGTPNFQTFGTNLITTKDVDGTTVTGGRVLATIPVSKSGSVPIKLSDYFIRIPPGLPITLAGAAVGGGTVELTVTLTWYEDI